MLNNLDNLNNLNNCMRVSHVKAPGSAAESPASGIFLEVRIPGIAKFRGFQNARLIMTGYKIELQGGPWIRITSWQDP